MEELRALIDQAANACGSYAALARRIGVRPQHVNAWKHGDRPLTPPVIADLCDVAGITGKEAQALLALATAENPAYAEKAGVMRRVFFACLMLGTAVAGTLPPREASTMTREEAQTAAQAPIAGTEGGSVYYVKSSSRTPVARNGETP